MNGVSFPTQVRFSPYLEISLPHSKSLTPAEGSHNEAHMGQSDRKSPTTLSYLSWDSTCPTADSRKKSSVLIVHPPSLSSPSTPKVPTCFLSKGNQETDSSQVSPGTHHGYPRAPPTHSYLTASLLHTGTLQGSKRPGPTAPSAEKTD